MSTGPIEFLGEPAADALGHTEYGGAPGVMQPELDPLGGPGHEATSSEFAAMMRRAQSVIDEETLVVVESEPAIDPVTGRAVTDDRHEDVTGRGGKFSDMKP